ncbi:MAG TPA: GAF domain-containing protein [Anaerolineae bacterium]|nr:GAF domain-containing protein [Anaerolineae bacterium]HQI83975.1 GAF domain-containing protein [Anaerolineae bacterium]
MSLSPESQILQLLTWVAALVEVILSFYILALNARHTANRHISLLTFLLAVNNIAIGLLLGADSLDQALFPMQLYAAVIYTVIPAATVASVVLLRPAWLHQAWRWLWRLCYVALALPIVVTALDVVFGTHLWYIGLTGSTYTGGYVPLREYVSPTFYMPVIVVYGFIFGLLPLIPALSVLRDKQSLPQHRRMAQWLIGATLATLVLEGGLRSWLDPALTFVLVTLVYAGAYIYTFFYQVSIERRIQRGQLRNRLTALFLSITLPVLIIGVLLVSFQTRTLLRRSAANRLGAIANLTLDAVNLKVVPSVQDLQKLIRSAVAQIGDTGVVYTIDSAGRIVSHSELDLALLKEDDPLRDASRQPPVLALRQGRLNELVVFKDDAGTRWWAYATEVRSLQQYMIVQQQEAAIAQDMQSFLGFSWMVIGIGSAVLLILGFLTIQYSFAPIVSLTETARAIVAGDLTREAAIESEDEIGALAQAFNDVTARLNDLIASLETRVAERTQEVERRAEYLAITGGVSQAVASILDVDMLLDRVAHLISERFGFYHTGIFLLDENREWAVLSAVSSEGGERMLTRGHRLRVGEQGIVGYVSGAGRARIALDVDEDAVWVKNPDLPETRSEMALPLIVGQEVIGVLDVQSQEAEAFGTEDITTLRILADQIAVAIRNAQLFEQSQRALQELQKSYGEEVREGWAWRPSPVVGYRYTPLELTPLMAGAARSLVETATPHVAVDNTLIVPLQLAGGQNFGVLRVQRDAAQPWINQDITFVERAVEEIAQALEVARLLEESRRRATREMQVNEIANLFSRALDVDVMLQTAARELGRLPGIAEVAVHIDFPESLSDVEIPS